MAVISEQQINLIRSKANIVDVISKYIPLTQKGRNYFGVCPFHDDTNPSMSVSQDKQIYRCFSCGASGNVFTFVQNYENISWPEAVSQVGEIVGEKINVTTKQEVPNIYKTEHEIMSLTEKYYINNLKSSVGLKAIEYLKDRGINEEIIEEFSIGLSLDHQDKLKELLVKKDYNIKTIEEVGLINDKGYNIFQKRIMFPLWDITGQVIGFSGRIYQNEDDAKYINSKENKIFKKGHILYNYHNAVKHAKREGFIIVVEGFMDAIRISSINHKNVVALMGTAMTSDQINILKKLRTKVYLCLDNDNAGKNATISIGNELQKNKIDVQVIKMSDAKDPDEYIINKGDQDFTNLVKNPISYYEFTLSSLKENKNLNDAKELASYINEVIELTKEIEDPILKSLTINNLSKEYNIELDILKERIKVEEIKKTPVYSKEVNEKKSQLDTISEYIIYYLMSDSKFIDIYKTKLGFIENQEQREIANEILYYYKQYGNINIADFITYMGENKLKETLMNITALRVEEEQTVDTLIQYINSYKRLNTKNKINILKEKLSSELDLNKKIELTKKIAELKKGSVD